jgi:hypothetical protein
VLLGLEQENIAGFDVSVNNFVYMQSV